MLVKAMSVQNPYSYLLCAGVKDVENRTWKTDYRGWIYIHSSGGKDLFCVNAEHLPASVMDLTDESPYVSRMESLYRRTCDYYGLSDLFDRENNFRAAKEHGLYMVSGAIIGRVRLADIVENWDSPWSEPGAYHWIVEDAELFDKPIINVAGRLRLFDVEI